MSRIDDLLEEDCHFLNLSISPAITCFTLAVIVNSFIEKFPRYESKLTIAREKLIMLGGQFKETIID